MMNFEKVGAESPTFFRFSAFLLQEKIIYGMILPCRTNVRNGMVEVDSYSTIVRKLCTRIAQHVIKKVTQSQKEYPN